MKPEPFVLASALALVATSLAVLGCGGPALPPSAPKPALAAPIRLDLPSNAGELVTVPPNAASAKAFVLDFWAPTCVPCQTSVPALAAQRAELAEKGAELHLVAVLSTGETTELAEQTLRAWGAESPFLIDTGGVSRSIAGVRDLPTTLIVDRSGNVRWVAPPNAPVSDVVAAAASVAAED